MVYLCRVYFKNFANNAFLSINCIDSNKANPISGLAIRKLPTIVYILMGLSAVFFVLSRTVNPFKRLSEMTGFVIDDWLRSDFNGLALDQHPDE